MNEKQELIARALEIAINLTGADKTYITRDDDDNIKIHDPLYSSFKMILTILNDKNIDDFDKTRTVSRSIVIKERSK